MIHEHQISLKWIMLVLFIYSLASALLSMFRLPLIQIALALSILTLFVGGDLWWIQFRRDDQEAGRRKSLALAYYATAFAIATLGCFAGFLIEPHSPPASLVVPLRLRAGSDAGQAFVSYIFMASIYFSVFALFSSIGFVASWFSFRHSRLGFWLLIANCPGAAAIGLSLTATLRELLFG